MGDGSLRGWPIEVNIRPAPMPGLLGIVPLLSAPAETESADRDLCRAGEKLEDAQRGVPTAGGPKTTLVRREIGKEQGESPQQEKE
jgi:hypothetical protein